MEPSCVHHTLIPGSSRLFTDYLYNFDRVRGFYRWHFLSPDALDRSAQAVDFPDKRREALVSALREQNNDPAALDKLGMPGTVAVVTGQQVGLFSGPAYTIFKALTAVKLAAQFSAQGIPAVPVFWLATEDHDLAEVDHAWVFNEDASPEKVSLHGMVAANGGPVGRLPLTDVPLTDLRQALGTLPFAEEVVECIREHYHPGATLGSAFRSFLADTLRGFGLLYMDPLAPAIRELAAPFLRDAIGQIPELIPKLRQRNAELESSGYHAQVLVEEDAGLLFLLGEHKRTPIRFKNGRFATKDRTYTAREMQALAAQLSPSALLRPVMEDYLLPTASYVGGPAEIGYMAQAEVLYADLLRRMPVIFPRNSFTLLDARAEKLMGRYRLRLPEMLDYHESVRQRMAGRLVPSKLREELSSNRSAFAAELAKLKADLAGFDPTLARAAKTTTDKILYQMEKLSGKVAREAMRRDERAERDSLYLMNLTYPHRHLQERFYSIVPFLAKHGPDLPERLLAETQVACPDHMVRTV
ncbi:MAG: bacillithiol biosynthesis cysteine-adding enzyme BshC [Bryobacteraceae bacterium]